MMKKKFKNPAVYELMDILRDIAIFEHNNECQVNLKHEDNLNSNHIYLDCTFKNTKGRTEHIRRYFTTPVLLGASNASLKTVVTEELKQIEFRINQTRGINEIRFSELVKLANDRDWYGDCMVSKNKDGEIRIRCHHMPSYYGTDSEVDLNHFHSLFCTIKDGKIDDIWAAPKYLEGYTVNFDIEYEFDEEDE